MTICMWYSSRQNHIALVKTAIFSMITTMYSTNTSSQGTMIGVLALSNNGWSDFSSQQKNGAQTCVWYA